jgi:LysR family glycine cleavage system transcriptional activator
MNPASRPLPPLPLLRTFEAAARHLSFKQAAAELHVTPAAVSQQIKALEQQLGAPLFVRLTRALALTDAGQALLPELQAGLARIEAGVQRARAVVAGPADPGMGVTVVAPPSLAAHWLLPRLPDFHARHPDVALHLASHPAAVDDASAGRDPAALLRAAAAATGEVIGMADGAPAGAGPASLAIVFGPGEPTGAKAPPGHAGLRDDLLLAPDYLPVCAPAWLARHPLGAAADLQAAQLIHDDTIAGPRRGGPAWGWPQWLAAAGVDAARAARGGGGRRFSTGALAIQAALAGQGLALAARPLVAGHLAAGSLVAPFALALASPYRYHLVGHAATADWPAVAAFRQWLLEQASSPA